MPFLEYIHTYAVAAALVALLAMVVVGAAVGTWRLVPKRMRGMPLVVLHHPPLHHLRQAFAHRRRSGDRRALPRVDCKDPHFFKMKVELK